MIKKYSPEVVANMKNEYIGLLKKIRREGANIDALIAKLEMSDFFTAPASAKYHNNFEGGLVDHSLNVYYNLLSLVKSKHMEDKISEDNILITALLHDMAKINFYELSAKNEKKYSDTGSKYDELGKFDWVASLSYKVKDEQDRFLFGNHEQTSEYMISKYIPLEVGESIAILNHHGGKGWDSTPINLGNIYVKYPLVALLHMADFMASFIDEVYYE